MKNMRVRFYVTLILFSASLINPSRFVRAADTIAPDDQEKLKTFGNLVLKSQSGHTSESDFQQIYQLLSEIRDRPSLAGPWSTIKNLRAEGMAYNDLESNTNACMLIAVSQRLSCFEAAKAPVLQALKDGRVSVNSAKQELARIDKVSGDLGSTQMSDNELRQTAYMLQLRQLNTQNLMAIVQAVDERRPFPQMKLVPRQLHGSPSFWLAVKNGVLRMLDWRILLGMVACALANFGFLMATGKIWSGESGPRKLGGCMMMMILGPLVQGFIMSSYIAVYYPVLLGGKEVNSMAAVLGSLWPILVAGGVGVISIMLVSIVPIIGGFVANSPGVSSFLQAVIIFRIFCSSQLEELARQMDISAIVYPGFWGSIGFIIVGAGAVYGTLMAVTLATTAIANKAGRRHSDDVTSLLAMGIGPSIGLIPLFMYADFLAQNFR